MNIAIFASAFYPQVGGVEELCRQLAHAYRSRGHGCMVLTNRWPRSLPRYEEYEGIPVYRLAMRVPEGTLKARFNYRLTHGRICREVIDILKRHGVDLLHVQCVSSNGYYALLAKRALRLPLVMTAQGERTMDAGKLYEKSPFANSVLRELASEADAVTACSGHTLTDLEEWYGKPFGRRGTVIHNGIRLADFDGVQPYPHPKPYVLGIGRLVPQKGFNLLIEAYAAGLPCETDLLLAGEGPERESLMSRAAKLKVADRVHFVGRANRTMAVSLFKGCEIFVLPSVMEPQGIVILEAMAAGKAVIASRVGGVPEIVSHRKTGLLFDVGDVSALSMSIRQLLTDADLRGEISGAGKSAATQFDWSIVADRYIRIYEDVVHSARSRLTMRKPEPQGK